MYPSSCDFRSLLVLGPLLPPLLSSRGLPGDPERPGIRGFAQSLKCGVSQLKMGFFGLCTLGQGSWNGGILGGGGGEDGELYSPLEEAVFFALHTAS